MTNPVIVSCAQYQKRSILDKARDGGVWCEDGDKDEEEIFRKLAHKYGDAKLWHNILIEDGSVSLNSDDNDGCVVTFSVDDFSLRLNTESYDWDNGKEDWISPLVYSSIIRKIRALSDPTVEDRYQLELCTLLWQKHIQSDVFSVMYNLSNFNRSIGGRDNDAAFSDVS